MQSNLVINNFHNMYQKLSINDKTALLTWSRKYRAAYNSTDMKTTNSMYPEYLAFVKAKEQETGIQVMESPNGTYYAALIELSNRMCAAEEELKRGEDKVISFGKIADADAWLMQQDHITVRSFRLETTDSLGFFANHTVVKNVTIHYTLYKLTSKYRYRITEIENSHMLFRHKENDLAKMWNEKNPGTEYISGQSFRNARGNSSSLAFGFGNYMEHIKHIILYRVPLEPSAKTETVKDQPQKCPKCSCSINGDYAFCMNCGYKLR